CWSFEKACVRALCDWMSRVLSSVLQPSAITLPVRTPLPYGSVCVFVGEGVCVCVCVFVWWRGGMHMYANSSSEMSKRDAETHDSLSVTHTHWHTQTHTPPCLCVLFADSLFTRAQHRPYQVHLRQRALKTDRN